MIEYQIDGTVRTKECDKDAPVSHLTLVYPWTTWKSKKIIKMIENKEAIFWSYHYNDERIDEEIKIIIEVVDNPYGKHLRTRRDETEENNLLELPMYHKDEDAKVTIASLKKLAKTKEQAYILKRIEQETIPSVRDAWIDYLLEKNKISEMQKSN